MGGHHLHLFHLLNPLKLRCLGISVLDDNPPVNLILLEELIQKFDKKWWLKQTYRLLEGYKLDSIEKAFNNTFRSSQGRDYLGP